MPYPFNVRVYGLLINAAREVLVTDEWIKGMEITKFPGGGLEFGEGTTDALKREMIEETGTPVEIIEHFYTTDFFQASAFNSKTQVLSIYYRIKALTPLKIKTTTIPFNFAVRTEGAISFRYLPLKTLSASQFTFPIDKTVAQMLQKAGWQKK